MPSTPLEVPSGEPQKVNLRQSESICRQIAKSHYENFLVASILLPRRIRQPFYNIYAFCRTADDLADESASPQAALSALEDLEQHLNRIYDGQIPHASLFPALADTIATFDLSKKPFDDLISAFRQDQHIRSYESQSQLIDYCRRSANPVGNLVLQLAGALNSQTADLSDQICTGLQLANFWQDVARDHQIGRIYLPSDLRQQYAITDEMLGKRSTPTAVRELLRFLCDETEAYFHRGLPLSDHVPRWLASDVKLFAHGGLATLDAIRKIDFDVLRIRPVVTKRKQLTLVTRALLGTL